MRQFIAILAVVFVFGLQTVALAQGSTDGVINGQVINNTEEGGSVSAIEVTLITYIDDMMAGTRTAQTDGDGRFQFDGVATEHEYLLSAKYMGVDYYRQVVFTLEEAKAYVEVMVCDATTSDEAIKVELAHTIIDIEEESFLITEVFGLVNDGDRTYVGTDGVLVFTLPDGATGFEVPQELIADYLFLDDSRVAYLVPFPPGERQLVFSYQMTRPSSDDFVIPLAIDYPTDNLSVMVDDEDIGVASTQLAPAGLIDTGTGQQFLRFQGDNFPRGVVINLYFSNLSKGSGSTSVILWVIAAIVIIGIAIYFLGRKKKGYINE